ncbi:MAG: glycoside hydrolase family 25 [Lachnospiraceae bacterium]|nr:glycoside hydrolase family 25 [Lachnospiraceae bacterium]
MKKRGIQILAAAAAAASLLAVLFLLVKTKKLQINRWIVSDTDVIGVDISEYQADVDMQKLASQGISFVYMKATEGSSFEDSRFVQNWENAAACGIPAGAYHFFSFDSPGRMQAENFINRIGDLDGRLIPAVDVEFYADKRENQPDPAEVTAQLRDFLNALEAAYHVKPMIYCPREIYEKYIMGYFDEYPRWIRSVYYPASFEAGVSWVIWQYCDTGELEGYEGGEQYIDLDVLHRGTELTSLYVGETQ